jgi:hypothetical protein
MQGLLTKYNTTKDSLCLRQDLLVDKKIKYLVEVKEEHKHKKKDEEAYAKKHTY